MKRRVFYNLNRITLILLGLAVCFLAPRADAQNKARPTVQNRGDSPWIAYDNVVDHIKKGETELAKSELKSILDGIDKGRFSKQSDEHTTRLLQYKSHVILANLAFAEKRIDDLDDELLFFENADTTKIEWRRAGFTARHFKHKYYQLSKGKFGKVIGDWVSPWKNHLGTPMVWIRIFESDNTLFAELKDCGIKTLLSTKYPQITNKIALDNVKNVLEIHFGDSRLMPGLQFLPSVAISTIKDASYMISESIARQSIAKHGTAYSSDALVKQLGTTLATTLVSALIAQLSVTKETMVSESIVMEQIYPEIYKANIKLRAITSSSNGKVDDNFDWTEILLIHLYPEEERDFSKGNFDKSMSETFQYLLCGELFWENTKESDEAAFSAIENIDFCNSGICNVENTLFKRPFYFLGNNINYEIRFVHTATCFSGLAQSNDLFGLKEQPINPRTNTSEMNAHIIPLRGKFTTVLSPTECVTFIGDWNDSEKCGNGLLSYVNTDAPKFNFSYEGTIKKGYPHGLGIWQGTGFRYVGWFYEGEKFGYGTMSYDNGNEEQGFVTKEGNMIPEGMVTQEMIDEFNRKVDKISKHKFQILDE